MRVALRYALAVLGALLFTAACQLQLPRMRPVHERAAAPRAPGLLTPQIPDPPSQALRISYLKDGVSFRAAGSQTWSRAELNRPIVEGDALWADVAARAELHVASAALRMDARTYLEILRFDDRTVQAKVTEGVVNVRVRRLESNDVFEIDTPNAAVTFLGPGEYRLDIQPAMDTTFVTVRSGEAEVSGTHLDFTVHAKERANISGSDAMEYGIAAPAVRDAFDEFCEMRDVREDRSVSAQYVAAGVNGFYDLDDFGAWHEDAEPGPRWTPRGLPEHWAPYRFGHWAWTEPWGWTWIDDAPWGFAPFHYGRWAFRDGAWSWFPGPRNTRPVYAPALVLFAGGGRPGFRYFFWIEGPGVAWFPLAPGERYVPPYRCSPSYLANINAGAGLAPGHYANLSVEGAFTAVPREVFVCGRSAEDRAAPVSAGRAERAIVEGSTPPVAPTEESLAPRTDRFVLEPPERTQTTAVLGRMEPAPRPLAFRLKQPLLDAHPGRPLEATELENLRKAAPEQPRADVRPARLGMTQPEPVAPPVLAPTPEEERRQQSEDARRLRAIQRESSRP